jgi:UDP-N-acetylglucosamine 2-epimerase
VSLFVSVVGARPQFVKLAPVCRAFDALSGPGVHRIVHTGQHYDREMSDLFFEELDIPRPDIDLGIGSGPHGRQTASMLKALEAEFDRSGPDVVIVYGDTNSTLAAALAASKMNIPLCHIEAGLRSFDRSMPEEINRVVADHCSDRLYPPTPLALANLENEGLEDRSVQVGDVMLDAVQYNLRLAEEKSDVESRYGLDGRDYGVVTVHRPINTTPEALSTILGSLEAIAGSGLPLLFPMHPRTRAVLPESHPLADSGILIVEPLGHLDMLKAISGARVVITDSGGLQKEAAFVGTPCLTLRETTEWTETVEIGANELIGTSPAELKAALRSALETSSANWQDSIRLHFGDGNSARRIVEDLSDWSSR